MSKEIIIDCRHPEETRLAIIENNELEDYQTEIKQKNSQKGNIYIGIITRIEPSLQAAFVDYGDEKFGFLPFNEIAVKYFTISETKKKELIKNEIERVKNKRKNSSFNRGKKSSETALENNKELEKLESNDLEIPEGEETEKVANKKNANFSMGKRHGYKIEEVLEVGQKLVVQVVKDIRGNKGATITTYITIVGKLCIYTPYMNMATGVSKKIRDYDVRKELKDTLNLINKDLGGENSVIIRTASAHEDPKYIIKDFESIKKVWKQILEIAAKDDKEPLLIYKEADIIKKVLRDIDAKEVSKITVEGMEGFEYTKQIAKFLSPELVSKISLFKQRGTSIFNHFQVEDQIEALHSPVVHLKSGGYLVIHPTEALISIDINSGKSNKEGNVESTALKNNIEAAIEITKQVRIRDLSGLIIIDFIDMENEENKTAVEKTFREHMKKDLAKYQIGSISEFGLLEMSRQRLQASLIENVFSVCSHCLGTGYVRPVEMNALNILRSLYSEIEQLRSKNPDLEKVNLYTHAKEAMYLLNYKRKEFFDIEMSFNISIFIEADEELPYPFYKLEINQKEEEMPKAVLLVEQEINKREHRTKNNFHPREERKGNYYSKGNRRYSNKYHRKYRGNQKKTKKGFFAKLFS